MKKACHSIGIYAFFIFLMQLCPLNQVARQNLVVVLINIGLNVVDLVLVAMAQQSLLALSHDFLVCLLYLNRIEFQHIARLQIDETVRAVFEVKVLLQIAVEDMEQDDLVLIIFKVFQCLKHRFVVIKAVEHVGEDDHKAATVRHLSDLVQALRRRSRLAVVFVVSVYQFLQLCIDQLIVHIG